MSVCAPAARSSGPRIGRVGQRVAVDLARRQRGELAALGLLVGGLELRRALVDVEGARERLARVDVRVAQPRQPRQQQVELQLRPLGRGLGVGLAEQPREHGGRDVGEDVPGARRAAVPADLAVRVDRGHLGAAADLGAGLAGGPLQRGRHRAHAADRHVPVAVAVADHVVEEAAVLAQRRVVRARERADQPVRERDPALDVVVEGGVDRLAERPLHQRLPRRVLGDLGLQRLAGRQRLGERGEDPPADARGHRVERPPAVVRRRAGARRAGRCRPGAACRRTPRAGAAARRGPGRRPWPPAAARRGRSSATGARRRRATVARRPPRRRRGRGARARARSGPRAPGRRRRRARCGPRRRSRRRNAARGRR